ncbi:MULTISPECIES: peptide ABC transporter substrate-binding protein [Streptomyces]|uniref:peptide ABC transporter substrate-binding protein n=1 Tax=Streptomyces TaxID=1883 RepID=UPI00068CEA4E|nr:MULTISPECIES: ABC transporter substrate-binding protein [unclassified Streptomyces]MCM1950435.1 ABC transporter substrate-binding protein [Streptomyces sp. G2]
MIPIRSTALAAATVLTVVASATACGPSEPAKSNNSSNKPGGAYSVALTEPDHLLPGRTTSSYSLQVLQGLFDPPAALDPKDGTVKPLAAVSWLTEDNVVWTIKFRSGTTFHNGEKVTAASFADAWNAAAYGPNAWDANYYFAQIKGYDALNPAEEGAEPSARTLSGLKVLDETTLQVTLKAPFGQFPMLLSFPAFAPLPKAATANPDASDIAPIGNGPYQLDGAWERNQKIRLKKFPGYRGSREPMADRVDFKIYTSRETAFTELQAGNVDVLTTVPAANSAQAKRLFGERFSIRPSGTMDYLGLPVKDPRFADPRLRKALSMAIDRKGITQAIYNGVYKPATSLVGDMIPGHRPDACGETCAYDPAAAKKLFEEAGGFKGPLELYFSNSDPTYEQWMTSVANQLKDNLGIQDVKFRKMAPADLSSLLNDGKNKGPFRQNWVIDYPSIQNYLDGLYYPGNRSGWSNEEFDALVAEGNALQGAEAVSAYQKAEDIALRELPYIPLWNWQDQSAWSDRIGNVVIDPYAAGLHLDRVTVND